MMAAISTYTQQWHRTVKTWTADPGVRLGLRTVGLVLCGFLMSAASLGNAAQPLVLSLLCACAGWTSLLVGAGGLLGYLFFWGEAGLQGIAWTLLGIPLSLILGTRTSDRDTPYLLPAVAALSVAACGLLFQIWLGDTTGVGIYFLRILVAAGGALVFSLARDRRDAMATWVSMGLCVLALAQVAPSRWLSLGYVAAGALSVSGAFPAVVLAGLALDLARITPIPMTAVACLVYLARLIPWGRRWAVYATPGIACIGMMALCGVWDLTPLPGLVIGGGLGILMPGEPKTARRRGATAVAQVRLEMVSEVFAQVQQLLLEAAAVPIDESALLERAAARACGSCPARKSCREREGMAKLPQTLLHRPLLDESDLPLPCRKSGRFLSELRRGQEQLRSIRADRERQKEYRWAVIQQYQFLSRYLQELSDELGSRAPAPQPRYRAEVAVSANRAQSENGDRCQWFAGVGCRYYVILCDGMGTGIGAVEEGNEALRMLKRLLCAGYPPEYALRSLNSLCALRGTAGAVTVDLAELQLDTGKACIYKWGAAASYVIRKSGPEKIGTATPPPGLSVTEERETVEQLSLRRGEMLVMLSDGVGGEDALRSWVYTPGEPPGELATRILERGGKGGKDDATVVAVRLTTAVLSA